MRLGATDLLRIPYEFTALRIPAMLLRDLPLRAATLSVYVLRADTSPPFPLRPGLALQSGSPQTTQAAQ